MGRGKDMDATRCVGCVNDVKAVPIFENAPTLVDAAFVVVPPPPPPPPPPLLVYVAWGFAVSPPPPPQ
jgi:hypothetical protein